MLNRTLIIIFIIIAAIFISLWVLNNYNEKKEFINVVLKIDELPNSVDIVDKEIRSFVDHHAVYILNLDEHDFSKLIAGRIYVSCESKGRITKRIISLIDYHPDELSECYVSGNVQNVDGRVDLYHNQKKTKLVVVYYN